MKRMGPVQNGAGGGGPGHIPGGFMPTPHRILHAVWEPVYF